MTMPAPSRFSALFASERVRLLAALVPVTEGGLIESIEHVGSTSLPGTQGLGVVDIAIAAWPFPLIDEPLAALRKLGYRPLPATGATAANPDGEQRFRHARKAVQLWVVEPGSDRWQNFITVREYLAHNPEAARPMRKSAGRTRRSAHMEASATARRLPSVLANKDRQFARLLPRANAWWVAHYGFGPVEAVAAELSGFDRPWHIASGWALDLALGKVTRVHHDVDVEFARADQLALRAYLEGRGWKFVTPFEGRLEPWPPEMHLEGTRHQAHAHRDAAFIDCLFSDVSAEVWYYRRQPEVVRLRARAERRTASGLPFLAPELVLLFKSRNTSRRARPQDQADFECASPHLDPEQRAWLCWALAATQPGHPWLDHLA